MPRNVVIDTKQLNTLVSRMQELPRKDIPKAYTAALNRTLDHVYTQTGRAVTQHYNVKVSEIRASMTKNKASFSKPRAWIKVRSRRFTLGRFLPGGLKSKSKVARVKIKKSAGYKRVGGQPPAFVQRSHGNTHVFRRLGDKRYPIDVLRTISPTQMVENIAVTERIQDAAKEMLAKRIEHEINRRLERMRGK